MRSRRPTRRLERLTLVTFLSCSACTLDDLTIEGPVGDASSSDSKSAKDESGPVDVESGPVDAVGDATDSTTHADTSVLDADAFVPPDTADAPVPDCPLPDTTDTMLPPDTGVTPTTWNVTVGYGGSDLFNPNALIIKVGDTVKWTWAKGGHSVTSGPTASCIADLKFCSPSDVSCVVGVTSAASFVYSHKFTVAGTYPYFCDAHCPSMFGTITVTP